MDLIYFNFVQKDQLATNRRCVKLCYCSWNPTFTF